VLAGRRGEATPPLSSCGGAGLWWTSDPLAVCCAVRPRHRHDAAV